jgi:DNA-binding MarR family transcriptional regulator
MRSHRRDSREPVPGHQRDVVTAEEHRLWLSFLAAHGRVTREIDGRLQRRHSLPLSTFDALAQIAHAGDGAITVSELADRIHLSPSRVSRLVMDLERRGAVTRSRSTDDARSTRTAITARGRALLAEALPTYLAAVREQLLDRLSTRELESLVDVLL